MKHKNNTRMPEISLMEFYDCFLKQSRPPTLQMFDYEFMSSIQESVTNESISINKEDTIVADDILNGKITKNEIYFALRKVKKGKTAGIDGFPVELITEGKNYFMPFLEILFNSIFESGVYPDTWVSGLITPIHKKGDKLNPENYRKVTVLPALGKLFEIVLENRLTYKNKVCCDNDQFQAGL